MEYTIKLAENLNDYKHVYDIMLQAFEEYRYIDAPSSALNESLSQLQFSLSSGKEKAVICYNDHIPIGSARFTINDGITYFSRVSVLPSARRRGVAKEMLKWIEGYSKEALSFKIKCSVRKNLDKNLQLYQNLGYEITTEEVVTKPDGILIHIVLMEKNI